MGETTADRDLGRRFPAAPEIRLVQDPVTLQAMLDDVSSAICHIRAKLEYPPTDDPDWDRRHRNALAYGLQAGKEIEKQIRRLTKGSPDPALLARSKAERERSRAERAASEAERTKAAAAVAQAKIEEAKAKQVVQKIQAKSGLIKRACWHMAFVRAARDTLAAEAYASIEELADRNHLAILQREIDQTQ